MNAQKAARVVSRGLAAGAIAIAVSDGPLRAQDTATDVVVGRRGSKAGDHLKLWSDLPSIGIQPPTMYFRIRSSCAWYNHDQVVEQDAAPGADGVEKSQAMMSLSDGEPGKPNRLANSGRVSADLGTVQPRAILRSGEPTDIATGRYLCDGSNGTPDLRDRFIAAASQASGYHVGDTGGAATVSHRNRSDLPVFLSSNQHGGPGITRHDAPEDGGFFHQRGLDADERQRDCRSAECSWTGEQVETDWTADEALATCPPYCALAFIQYRPEQVPNR